MHAAVPGRSFEAGQLNDGLRGRDDGAPLRFELMVCVEYEVGVGGLLTADAQLCRGGLRLLSSSYEVAMLMGPC